MKLYFDCVYTQRIGHCASFAKMKKIAKHLLAWREDIFIYWQIPVMDAASEDRKHLIEDDRIKYIDYPYQVHDRLKEFMRADNGLFERLYFQGECWDADMVITNRASLVPLMKSFMYRPGTRCNLGKRVFLIEDMPMMDFKLTVPISNRQTQPVQTVAGYLAADAVAMSAFWEKSYVIDEAKEYFSPSAIKQLREKIIESSPILLEKMQFKTKSTIKKMIDGERPFTPAFCGRVTSGTRSEEIMELMEKFWIFNNGERQVECIASTQSIVKYKADGSVDRVGRVNVPATVKVKNLPREQFWEMMQKQVDVLVFMSPEEDYSMSLVEPMTLGTPAILIDCRWTRPTFGDDYPFYVKNMQEAYALLIQFFEDYPRMYAKWYEWSKNVFEPMMMERNKTYVCYMVQAELEKLEHDQINHPALGGRMKENEAIVAELLKFYQKHKRASIFEIINHPDMDEVFRGIKVKTSDEFQSNLKLTFGTDWHFYKMGLLAHGLKDASTKLGDMYLPEE